MEKVTNVDDFIVNSIIESQPILIALRKIIKQTIPGIEESIGYGVPQYKYKSRRIGISVAKKHVTIGFDYGVISENMRKSLEEKGYKLGLQTLQIKLTQQIPLAELQAILESVNAGEMNER